MCRRIVSSWRRPHHGKYALFSARAEPVFVRLNRRELRRRRDDDRHRMVGIRRARHHYAAAQASGAPRGIRAAMEFGGPATLQRFQPDLLLSAVTVARTLGNVRHVGPKSTRKRASPYRSNGATACSIAPKIDLPDSSNISIFTLSP